MKMLRGMVFGLFLSSMAYGMEFIENEKAVKHDEKMAKIKNAHEVMRDLMHQDRLHRKERIAAKENEQTVYFTKTIANRLVAEKIKNDKKRHQIKQAEKAYLKARNAYIAKLKNKYNLSSQELNDAMIRIDLRNGSHNHWVDASVKTVKPRVKK